MVLFKDEILWGPTNKKLAWINERVKNMAKELHELMRELKNAAKVINEI